MSELEGLGVDTAPIPFAYPLKLAGAAVLEQMGLSDAEATRYVMEDKDTPIPGFKDLTGRTVLLQIGENARAADPDVWVKRNEQLCGRENDYLIIVDDVRRENEYASLVKRGAYMIKVVRPSNAVVLSDTEGRLEEAQFDATILNDCTIPALRDKVRRLIKQWDASGE